MKLTKSKLISLIKEEISSIMEGPLDGPTRKGQAKPPKHTPDEAPDLLGPTRKGQAKPPKHTPDEAPDLYGPTRTDAVPPPAPGSMALIVKELEVLIKKIKAAM